ncbi:MAG: alpha/beta hydrolase [Proteobacteria bacterium]|nr:alpha/beta hydrolase [Pseudomonadota bacterium]
MAPRRTRAERPTRRWPYALLLVAGVLVGIVSWGYTPDLPAEVLTQRYATAQSSFIDVGGVRTHIRDTGQDPANPDAVPLVLLHGSLESLDVWDGWAKELAPRVRVIAVDLPGHGLTGTWERDEYTIDAYADFVEVLADSLHLDRFALGGHSMGGAVAWSFANTRPERVSHLVLVDSSGYPGTGGAPLSVQIARLPVIGGIGIYFKPDPLVRRTLLEVYADPAMVTPERMKRYAELQRFPGNRHATLLRVRTQDPLDPTPLKRLGVPTLILWGARDRWVPVADAHRFQNDIKGSKLEIFSGLGHNPMEEDPVATARAVAAFLPDKAPPRPEPPVRPPPRADDSATGGQVRPANEPEPD